MAIIQGNAKQGSTRGFYPKIINGSLRFNKSETTYLEWTPASAGNRKTWTFSAWVKYCVETTDGPLFACYDGDVSNRAIIAFDNGEELAFTDYTGGTAKKLMTDQEFRDPSAWYHIVVRFDSTQATESDRTRFYINGTQVTSFRTGNENYVAQNHDGSMNRGVKHLLGGHSTVYLHGYMAEVFFLDGQSKAGSDFGELKNGVWVPKNVTATDFTMGTNGFYLTFEDDTQVEAFNTVLWRGNGGTQSITGTGFQPDLVWIKQRTGNVNATSHHHLVDSVRGRQYSNWTDTADAEHTSPADRDLVSFDSDGFTVGTPNWSYTNVATENYVAWCWDAGANNAITGHSSVTYTGSGSTMRVSGFPFSPDLVWYKNRGGAYSHRIYDTVRGAAQRLIPNSTGAETANVTNELISFDKDGFVLAGGDTATNTSGQTYVAWAWDAGDSDPVSNTAGTVTSTVKASTANGFSIVSWTGNATQSTIGHGLSSAPDFLVVKNRDSGTSNWNVWHTDLTTDYSLYLNLTNAENPNAPLFFGDGTNMVVPTDSVFTVGSNSQTNGSGNDIIAYCWHDVTGKQKFGTYTGDGTSDGSKTITTGFRPGFLMVKRTDSAENWQIVDGSRDPLNNVDGLLWANLANAESTADFWEFTDTGFKILNSNTEVNANGGTYIYAAFAGSYSDYITDYNTDGSIDSRVKASDTTGFSVVSYTGNNTSGATVGHGLSSAPDFIITKDRSSATYAWTVYHSSLSANNVVLLNQTNGQLTPGYGYYTSVGASTYTLTSGGSGSGNLNASGDNYIAYCWTATAGRSAFGSYTGNGSSSGPSVTTNFNPACLIVKRTDTTGNWFIWDNTRDTDGVFNTNIHPNLSNAEAASGSNFVTPSSTGFQLTGTGAETNASGGTYIYAAFADTREAAFWLDQSTNDNDWQPVNLDHNDTVSDSPTDNFCTWNPLNKGTNLVTSDGNLSVNNSTTETTHRTCVATHGMTSGKYYWEIEVNNSAYVDMVGIVGQNATLNSGHVGTSGFGYGYSTANGNWYKASGWADDGTTPAAFPTSGTIGVAFDADNKKIYFSRNGEWINNANPTAGTGANGTYTGSETVFFPAASMYYNTGKWVANFGQQPFKYDPPA